MTNTILSKGIGMRFLKRTVPLVVTGGFFAAALFLVGLVLSPANAETPSSAGIETSLLLSVDQPETPAARTIQIEDDAAPVDVAPLDLATELNNWAFTNNPHEPRGPHPPPHPHPHVPPPPHHHPKPPPHHHHHSHHH